MEKFLYMEKIYLKTLNVKSSKEHCEEIIFTRPNPIIIINLNKLNNL
jgi:hypothetical protein